MLSRVLRNKSQSLAKDLNTRMAEVAKKIEKVFPSSLYEGTEYNIPEETKPKTMDEKLAELDSKVAKIEALREAGKPEEIRIRNLTNKYGRTGRHPAYPWYGNEVPFEDRIPHLADRLGKYSEMGSKNTVINDWLQLKSDQSNPVFHSFFVQEPSKNPDPDVNFEKGEIIYDNPHAWKGGSLIKQTGLTSLLYVLYHAGHTLVTNRTVYPVYTEAGDHRADGFSESNYYGFAVYSASNSDWHDIETLSNVGFIAPLAPLCMLSFVWLLKCSTEGIVTKMQFNKNRDLVFVTKVGGTFFAKEIEEVYETTHLQVLPPSVETGYMDVNDRKLFTISCMTSHVNFRVYKNPSYWNPELKEEFFGHLHHLWEE